MHVNCSQLQLSHLHDFRQDGLVVLVLAGGRRVVARVDLVRALVLELVVRACSCVRMLTQNQLVLGTSTKQLLETNTSNKAHALETLLLPPLSHWASDRHCIRSTWLWQYAEMGDLRFSVIKNGDSRYWIAPVW